MGTLHRTAWRLPANAGTSAPGDGCQRERWCNVHTASSAGITRFEQAGSITQIRSGRTRREALAVRAVREADVSWPGGGWPDRRLNITKIVVTGDMTSFGQPWLDAIRNLREFCPVQAQATQIEIGFLAGMRSMGLGIIAGGLFSCSPSYRFN
jgi:hypothetical protein